VLRGYKWLVQIFLLPEDKLCFAVRPVQSICLCGSLGRWQFLHDGWRLDAERACWNVEANGVKNWISLKCVADREENPSRVPDWLPVLQQFQSSLSKPLYYRLFLRSFWQIACPWWSHAPPSNKHRKLPKCDKSPVWKWEYQLKEM